MGKQRTGIIAAAAACVVAVIILLMAVPNKKDGMENLPETAMGETKEQMDAVRVTEPQETETASQNAMETMWDAYFATREEPHAVLEEYQGLKEEIPELVGWLCIPDTGIDYPVVQGSNDFYTGHDPYGNEDVYGSIFLEQVNDINKPDNNLLIYGHNRKDSRMFGELMEYKSEDYYRAHPYIEFDTLYAHGTYEIIAVFLSRVYYSTDTEFKYYQFFGSENEEEFQNYVDNVKELSLYPIEADAAFGDELITLSTCEYSVENGRLAIVAKKLPDGEKKK